jgi:hypothetical protein
VAQPRYQLFAAAHESALAHRVSSPQRMNSGAIGGIADMPRSPAAHLGAQMDPKPTSRPIQNNSALRVRTCLRLCGRLIVGEGPPWLI